jgi:hypothetical protein
MATSPFTGWERTVVPADGPCEIAAQLGASVHLVGGSTVELLSSTEPQRLTNGEVTANWVDARGGTVGHVNWQHIAVVTWRRTKPSGVA